MTTRMSRRLQVSRMFRLMAIACGVSSAHLVVAVDLNWSLPVGADHRTGAGAPLPAGTRFQIGVFINGFIPGAANADAWAANWRSRAEVLYDPELQGFGATMHVEENPAPFAEGATLYVWGFRQTGVETSEWFLVSHPSWGMPSADPFGFPRFFDLPDGNVILGSADPVARTITTATVGNTGAPRLLWEDWRSQHFFLVERADPSVSGKDADPDGDGFTNWMEYALGTDPGEANRTGRSVDMKIARTSATEVTVSFPGTPTVPAAWRIEASGNLVSWETVFPAVSYEFSTGRWMFRNPLQGSGFWRLVAAPPP